MHGIVAFGQLISNGKQWRMAMRISFVVPVYNVGKYIAACLDSLKRQDFQDMEVIMINDGSTDDSEAVCRRFEENDQRFHLINQENKGAAGARNTGIDAARGEWISFVDGDDIIESGFLNKNQFENYEDSDMVFFGYSKLESDGSIIRIPMPKRSGPLPPAASGLLSKYILNPDIPMDEDTFPKAHVITGPCIKFYRTDFLKRNQLRFKSGFSVGEDNYFNFTVYRHAPRCYVSDIYMYIYRQNQNSATNRYNAKSAEVFTAFYNALVDYIENEGAQLEYSNYLAARAVRNFQYCCALDFCHKDNPKSFFQRRREFLGLRNNQAYAHAFRSVKINSLRLTVRIGAILCKYKLFALYCFSWWLTELLHVNHA